MKVVITTVCLMSILLLSGCSKSESKPVEKASPPAPAAPDQKLIPQQINQTNDKANQQVFVPQDFSNGYGGESTSMDNKSSKIPAFSDAPIKKSKNGSGPDMDTTSIDQLQSLKQQQMIDVKNASDEEVNADKHQH